MRGGFQLRDPRQRPLQPSGQLRDPRNQVVIRQQRRLGGHDTTTYQRPQRTPQPPAYLFSHHRQQIRYIRPDET